MTKDPKNSVNCCEHDTNFRITVLKETILEE